MLALQDGQAGVENLKAWASYAQRYDVEFPPVWILCPNLPVCKELVETTQPEFRLLVVDTDSSWTEALNKFVLQVQSHRRPPFTYLIALRCKNKERNACYVVACRYERGILFWLSRSWSPAR